MFGTGEKSFEKYESGEIQPSEPAKRLLKLALRHPDLFQRPEKGKPVLPTQQDVELIHKTLREADMDRIYAGLFNKQKLPSEAGRPLDQSTFRIHLTRLGTSPATEKTRSDPGRPESLEYCPKWALDPERNASLSLD